MKRLFFKNLKIPIWIDLALIAAGGVIIMLLIIGTIYALVRPANSGPLFRLGRSNRTETNEGNVFYTDIRVHPGIGRLRIPLSDSSSTLVLGISFPYAADDMSFAEELNTRTGEFRNIAIEYFSSLPAESIDRLDEEAAKREILRRYNSILRLGRIETLYFTDLVIFSTFM